MKIIFATSSRADFGLIRPILKTFSSKKFLSIKLVCVGDACRLSDEHLIDDISGSISIERFFPSVDVKNFSKRHQPIQIMSQIVENFSSWLNETNETFDWIIIPGDRFEIFGITIASYYNTVPIAHVFGGDRTEGGHLDDNVRNAITKLANLHFPVCEDSFCRILKMGEEKWRVFNLGSPVVESIQEILNGSSTSIKNLINSDRYNIICTYHPIGTEGDQAGQQFDKLLEAFSILESRLPISVIFTYPNNEYGSADIVERLNRLKNIPYYQVIDSLGWKKYLATLKRCSLAAGNSSSLLLEAPILGTPSLLVGTRQKGRFSPEGVYHIEEYDPKKIADAMEDILLGKPKIDSHPYGIGNTSIAMLKSLETIQASKSRQEILQKKSSY